MNKLLEAAEVAVNEQPYSAPGMDWIRNQAARRRRKRRAVLGAGGVLAVGLVVMGTGPVVGSLFDGADVVAVEAAHHNDDPPPNVNADTGSGNVVDESANAVVDNGHGANGSEAILGDEATHPGPDHVDDVVEMLDIYQPIAGCAEGNTVPVGQAPNAVGFEPLGSIWCFELNDPAPPTAEVGDNSWVDDFDVNTYMHQFNDGDMGYRVFNQAGDRAGLAQHWINQNHWMVDAKGAFTGGSSLRPDRSFRFEDGVFVVEADFAAAIPGYGANAWGEITITSAPEPTGVFADNLYAYGQFGGHWAVGCRMQPDRVPVCAVEGPTPESAPDTGLCSALAGNYRVNEMSFFQRCGTEVMGGYPSGEEPWRQCEPAGMDMACRDRFRMEVSKDSLTLYVNGQKYLEDKGWPAAHQLPDSFVNGDIYVYQSNWQWRSDADTTVRFHWDHFLVNPPTGPEPSEWYR